MIRNHSVLYAVSVLVSFFLRIIVARKAIVGGTKAADGQFPYQVSIRYYNGRSYCGGGILNDRFILTAAHCIIGPNGLIDGMPISILAGTNNLIKIIPPTMIVRVKRIFLPKEYRHPALNSTGDIAVLMSRQPLGVVMNRNLRELKLPYSKYENYTGKIAKIAGFGWDWIKYVNGKQFGGASDTQLLFAEADVIGRYHKHYAPRAVSDKLLCARVKQRFFSRSRGVCTGDSGSPLVYNGTVIGILSRGPVTCTETDFGGTYTRVSYYLNFIENAMRNRRTDDTRILEIHDEEDF